MAIHPSMSTVMRERAALVRVVGYADRLSAAPGETIRFHVSATEPAYRAEIVRLRHGDTRPYGAGIRETLIAATVNGEYAGRTQEIPRGSCVVVADCPALAALSSCSITAFIYPTAPASGTQGLITRMAASAGIGLELHDGVLALAIGDGARTVRIDSGAALREREWYFVAASYDATTSSATILQRPLKAQPQDASDRTVARHAPKAAAAVCPLIMAAYAQSVVGERIRTDRHFNGKIDSPRLYASALGTEHLEALARGTAIAERPLAHWDFAADIGTTHVHDAGPNAIHGRTINAPMRGATGRNWSARELDFRLARDEYGAIHFHDDDLDDALWDEAFAYTLPADLPSGVYAARLTVGDYVDHVPFFVRPARTADRAPIAVLFPTLTYLAYSTEHLWSTKALNDIESLQALRPLDFWAARERMLSLYEHHSDGSGVCFSSRLRPLCSLRPNWVMGWTRAPCHFSVDLCLIDWLEQNGQAYDVITDEDVHRDGIDLLARYRVVITGNHPEYATRRMLEGIEHFTDRGGRLMYLGGNGFYWVTTIDPNRPHLVEVRRDCWGTWQSHPGEEHHESTGEHGGMWRFRGLPPNRLVGSAFRGYGFGCAGYRRTEQSRDPRVSGLFDGIADDEIIGAFGMVMGGAAGHEIDAAERSHGTPAHALVIATTVDVDGRLPWMVAPEDRDKPIRGDIVYFETPSGGAVFSVGSMAWIAALSHDGYRNNVARLTCNVLNRFLERTAVTAKG
jgi:N,N-dimethylformamidase